MANKPVLIYTGGGWLPGVPARDLTADEAKQHGGIEYLISTGLYKAAEVKK
jgi:hypothetical protein